ncbi:hypothetical protein A9Q84_11885 [Halobacteriovorax marinus]|uniref:Lipoprotein n=1 Tax=Halobacteriovorax marinus TaxID=97084 RepID=A0A1Y5F7X3_9BACT|nr:hypothetical protein A9Q84_11885 [Halobacteriovorax marinus]
MRLFPFIFIFLFLSACSHKQPELIAKKLEHHPVGYLSYWSWVKKFNLETKIHTKLTDEVTEYLNLWKESYDLTPATNLYPSQISNENFEHVFRYAILSYPRMHKIRLNKRLKAIFLVKGLGVSTIMVELKSSQTKHTGQFIAFLDQEVLNQKINDWYRWRELTAFKIDADYSFNPYLSHENNVVDTIHYTMAHLFAITLNWDPKYYPETGGELITKFDSFELIKESWKLDNEIISPKFASFPEDLNYIRYYTLDDKLFTTKDMPEFYSSLLGTNFPNLFALSSSSKDFIESIANYMHTVVLDKPFSVDIKNQGKIVETFNSCWQQSRCQSKRKVIEKILEFEK